jgi:ADP-ribosylglycohydrolase
MLFRRADSPWSQLRLQWSGTELVSDIGSNRMSVPLTVHDDGQMDQYATLAELARRLRPEQIELRACAACIRFRFSGMSYQMSGGGMGYCTLGGAPRQAKVRVDFGCGEFSHAAGWPDDLQAADAARRAESEREPQPSRLNAFKGCLLGLLVGDALASAPDVHAMTGRMPELPDEGSVTDGRPAHFSRAVQIALACAEQLVEAGRQDLNILMPLIAERIFAGRQAASNEPPLPGASPAEGENLSAVVRPQDAGNPESEAAESPVWAVPMGLAYYRDRDRRLTVARAASILSSTYPAALEGVATTALLVAMALEKRTPQDMQKAVLEQTAQGDGKTREAFERLAGLHPENSTHEARHDGLQDARNTEDVVAAAFYCFRRSPEDFQETCLTAASFPGDSNSIASIAAGISGAFNGAGAAPASWKTAFWTKRLDRLAEDLYSVATSNSQAPR